MSKNKSDKKLIAVTAAAAIIAAGVIVAALLASKNQIVTLDDDFFESDDTKLVMELEEDVDGTFENAEKSYIVYGYNDDKITSMAFYYRFADEATATANFLTAKEDAEADESVKSFSQNGRYLIVDFAESEYANIPVSEVRQATDFLEKINQTIESDIEAK